MGACIGICHKCCKFSMGICHGCMPFVSAIGFFVGISHVSLCNVCHELSWVLWYWSLLLVFVMGTCSVCLTRVCSIVFVMVMWHVFVLSTCHWCFYGDLSFVLFIDNIGVLHGCISLVFLYISIGKIVSEHFSHSLSPI